MDVVSQLVQFPDNENINTNSGGSRKFWWGGILSTQHTTSKIRMSSPKLRVIFRPKSEIQTFFSPKIRWSPKKKKKKRSSPKLRVIFRPKSEIQTFFSPKFRWSPNKKTKRSSPKLRVIFRPDSLGLGWWGGMHPEMEPNYSK